MRRGHGRVVRWFGTPPSDTSVVVGSVERHVLVERPSIGTRFLSPAFHPAATLDASFRTPRWSRPRVSDLLPPSPPPSPVVAARHERQEAHHVTR